MKLGVKNPYASEDPEGDVSGETSAESSEEVSAEASEETSAAVSTPPAEGNSFPWVWVILAVVAVAVALLVVVKKRKMSKERLRHRFPTESFGKNPQFLRSGIASAAKMRYNEILRREKCFFEAFQKV
jgi:hypothetical protein